MKVSRKLGLVGLAVTLVTTPVLAGTSVKKQAQAAAAQPATPVTESQEKPRQPGLFEILFAGAKPAAQAAEAQPQQAAPKRGKAHARHARALGYDAASRDRFRDLMAKHAAENGIPFALVDAVVRVESRYNPRAHNGGAIGLMQIKHRTAQGVGYAGSAAGLYNPENNIRYGVKYLAQAYRLAGGDTCGMVMRYQSGHYATRMNRANMAYCSKVRTIVASVAGGGES